MHLDSVFFVKAMSFLVDNPVEQFNCTKWFVKMLSRLWFQWVL